MNTRTRITTLAAATAGLLTIAAPAAAYPSFGNAPVAQTLAMADGAQADGQWQHSRDRRYRDDYRGYRGQRAYYGEPVYRNTRVWRGRDGRAYCRKKDGTTGLIIGGAVGALLGREIDGGRDRTLGTILGAAGGALLGRSIDRDGMRCR